MSFWSNPSKATKAFFGTKQPPRLQAQANNPIANKLPPINFTSIFDEISKDKLDIIRGLDGKLSLKFGNNDSRIDLNSPVRAGNVNTRLPAINPINERAAGVVALSQAMTRLSGAVEQMENTSPYLIAQNQELINSFRDASTKALDRGFDFRQYAIDQKLAKMGLNNSSTAFGVQVSLAREKANAYSDLELKQAELAQGLKQQSLANLHQRGDLLGKNAQVELGKFNSESQAELANQELILATEFGNRKLVDARHQRMAELGVNMMNNGNQQAVNAQQTDNNAVSQQNSDQLQRFQNTNPPLEHKFGRQLLGDTVGVIGAKMLSGFGSNPWKNPDSGTNPMSFGTSNWTPSSSKLTGSKSGGMKWS